MIDDALLMLSLFASVGVTRFDATRTNIDNEKQAYRADLSLDTLKRMLPAAMESADRDQHNLIIRPRARNLIQLDDLDPQHLAHVSDAAFMVISTSPGNHQAWIALESADGDFVRRVKQGSGADRNASGATRLAGTRNFKHRYEPNFPVVTIVDSAPGRVTTKRQLQDMGIVAPEARHTWVERHSTNAPRRWPSYERCLEGAPQNHSRQHRDVSRADFTWALIAAQWGWPADAIAEKLMELSTKAKSNERYARRTAENAADGLVRCR